MKKLLVFVVLATSLCPILGAAAKPKKTGYHMGTVVNPKCPHPDCKDRPAFFSLGDYQDHQQVTGHGVDVTAGRPQRTKKLSRAAQRALADQQEEERKKQEAKEKKSKTGKMKSKPREKARVNPMGVAVQKAAVSSYEDFWGKIQGWGEEVSDEFYNDMEEAWKNVEGILTHDDSASGTSSPKSVPDSGHESLESSPAPPPISHSVASATPMEEDGAVLTEEDDAWLMTLFPDANFVPVEQLQASPEFEKDDLDLDATIEEILQNNVVGDFNPKASVDEEKLFIPDVDDSDLNFDDLNLSELPE